jgi:membrane-associated phospholipid phosphatase
MVNNKVIDNFLTLRFSLIILPVVLLFAIVLFLFSQNSINAFEYTQIQKNYFYSINSSLGQFPNFQNNLTQLGDVTIIFSFLLILIIYQPKIWESLISASLISLVFSKSLKSIFDVPRPAVVFDNESFIIIGKTAVGYSSLPSGHSITIFTTLTILLYGFMPKDSKLKYLWMFFVIITGLFIAFSRVGVGAHHPLDVIIGSILVYISGLLGIFLNRKFKMWEWISNKKFYLIFIGLIILNCIVVIIKIGHNPLLIFYLALSSLLLTLYQFAHVYYKK